MNEDVMKILKMVEAGTISAEDGMKLIEAVSGDRKKPSGIVKSEVLSVNAQDGHRVIITLE